MPQPELLKRNLNHRLKVLMMMPPSGKYSLIIADDGATSVLPREY